MPKTTYFRQLRTVTVYMLLDEVHRGDYNSLTSDNFSPITLMSTL